MFTPGQKIIYSKMWAKMREAIFEGFTHDDEFCYIRPIYSRGPAEHTEIAHTRCVYAHTPEVLTKLIEANQFAEQCVEDYQAGKRGNLQQHVDDMMAGYYTRLPESSDPQGRARTKFSKQFK